MTCTYFREKLLKDRRNRSSPVWFHVEVRNITLQYIILGLNFNRARATWTHSVTTTRWILDAEILDAELETLTTPVRTRHRLLNYLERMPSLPYLDFRRHQCRYGLKSNELHILFHLHGQRWHSTMIYSAVYVWRGAMKRVCVRLFHLSFAGRSLIQSMPTFFLMQNAHAGTPLILITHGNHQNMVQKWLPGV